MGFRNDATNEEEGEREEGGHGGYKPNSRQWRIVLRNLPFTVTEASVRAAFEAFGVIEEIHIPTRPGRDGKKTPRGFGFINFSKKTEAKQAVEKGNNMQVLGRPVAVDWALAKEIFEEQNPGTKKEVKGKKGSEKKDKVAGAEGAKGKGGGEEEDEIVKSMKSGKEVPAKEEAKAKVDVGGDENNVFVRNIPLEATEKDVFDLMRKFGRTVFCKLVMDKTTGRHKGSAFVKFVERESAEKAVDSGCPFTGSDDWDKVQKKLDKKRDKLKKKGKLKDMLEVDNKNTLSLNGRLLFCAWAVDRTSAAELQGKEKIVKDRRNLWLAKEGLILEDSPAAKNTPPSDLQKRLRAWQDKKTKLSNSNFFINATRLSVRNISKETGEAELKKIFAAAALSGVKSGGPPVKVVSARLVMDKEKVDPVSGKGESKGYGFVEFTETDHALAALRKLNNCPKIAKASNGNKRLMVDFSVEDARIVRQRRIKADRIERTREKSKEARREEQEESGEKLVGRGAKQRANKRKKAEAGEEVQKGVKKARVQPRQAEGSEGQGKRAWMPRAGANTIITPTNGRIKRPREDAKEKREGRGGDDEMNRALQGTEGMVEGRGSKKAKPAPAKKAKGGGRDNNDDFDKLVKSYSTKMFGSNDGGARDVARWFD